MQWRSISSGILKYGWCDLMDKNAKIVCCVVLKNEKRGLMSCCLYSISYFCLSLHIVQRHKLWLQNKQASQTYVCIKRNPYSAFYLWMNYLLGHHLYVLLWFDTYQCPPSKSIMTTRILSLYWFSITYIIPKRVSIQLT